MDISQIKELSVSVRILLVEDEKSLREVISMNLELEGFEVITVDNGKKALQKVEDQFFDLIILDVMLPEIDGFSICEQIRINQVKTPVLFLTAKDSVQDRITGFKKGGDDYLIKPFNLEEFLLRVKALLKRTPQLANTTESLDEYRFGNNYINFSTFKAFGNNRDEITLTKREAALLKLLIERKEQVVSRNDILKYVWGYDVYPSTRTIDNFILHFRKIFEQDPKNPVFFKSLRGIGYKFTNQ